MSNLETLRTKLKFHAKDISVTDDELDMVIEQVFEDIALRTRIFKKAYGFTVHEEIELYDFREIASLNERTEIEISDVTTGTFTDDQIVSFFQNSEEWPDPEVTKTLFNDDTVSRMLGVIEIYDEYGVSVTDKFDYIGNEQYACRDKAWRDSMDDKPFLFIGYVVPVLDELRDEDMVTITSTIIEGAKYYIANTMQMPIDNQVSNLYYMRYFNKIKEIINQYPTLVYGVENRRKDRKWL
ncbi:MAG: hypothetical protein B6D63_04130 [Candidatus Latescibacteria bacterium 4484_7]|nr:MAG: hypothetical protein B6D63_04130 [Candidatus Latescibacteria bacterium 4484_7]